MGVRAGRASLTALAAHVATMREETTALNALTDDERAELTILAFTTLRERSRKQQAAQKVIVLRDLGARVAAMRAPAHDDDCGCTHTGTAGVHPEFTYRPVQTPSRKARP
jgi:hypothetical protein